MKSRHVSLSLLLVVLLAALGTEAQQATPSTSSPTTAVPHLVRFTGTIRQESGKPLTGVAGVTFALYKEDQGGAALWIETQNVQLDSSGRYSVMLGTTKPDGVSGAGNNVGGLFQATGSSGLVLKGLNPSGVNIFSVDQSGNLSTSGTLSGTGAALAGNGLFAFIGDPGCGGLGTTAIGSSNSGLSNCSNYAVRGDTGGNLYINSSSTGWMFFDHNNNGSMSLDPSGNLGVQGTIQINGAGKGVSLSDGSQLGHLYLAKNDAGGGIQSSAVIVSLQVPAGSYFITAKTSLANFDSSNQDAFCALSTGDQSFLYLQSSPPEVVVALEDSATFTAPTTITLTCNTFNGFAEHAKLAAVVVSGIN